MYSPQELAAIGVVTRTAACLGLAGALGVFALFFRFRTQFASPIGKLAFAMAVADLTDAGFKAIGTAGPAQGAQSVLCQTQGVGIQFGTLAAVFSSLLMAAWSVYLVCLNGRTESIVRRQYASIFVCTVALPAPLALYPVLVHPLLFPGQLLVGDTRLWCWIETRFFAYQLALFYVWLWTVLAINIATLAVTWNYLRHLHSSASRFLIKRMAAYLVAFVVAWAFSTLNRVVDLASGPVFALTVLQAAFSPSRGMWNFIAFYYSWYYSPSRLAATVTKPLHLAAIATPSKAKHCAAVCTDHDAAYAVKTTEVTSRSESWLSDVSGIVDTYSNRL